MEKDYFSIIRIGPKKYALSWQHDMADAIRHQHLEEDAGNKVIKMYEVDSSLAAETLKACNEFVVGRITLSGLEDKMKSIKTCVKA